jgi:hypothetical protein
MAGIVMMMMMMMMMRTKKGEAVSSVLIIKSWVWMAYQSESLKTSSKKLGKQDKSTH